MQTNIIKNVRNTKYYTMNKTIMITGANAGLGKDAARQLAQLKETEKIYLACRNEVKAKEAKADLEKMTNQSLFEIVIMDVSNPDSVRSAVGNLSDPIDALIMNAGGMGGKDPRAKTANGVMRIFAANVLGHVVLVDELLKVDKLKNVAMYASSEAVRGVKKMGMKKPALKSSSVEEFTSVYDGSFFKDKFDVMEVYSYVKYAATLWMSSMARKYPHVRFISMSPGATGRTNVMNDLPFIKRVLFKYIGFPVLMPLMSMVHKIEKGAERYVKAINDESLISGTFYASSEKKLTGPVVDQSAYFADLKNVAFQDHAHESIHQFIKK